MRLQHLHRSPDDTPSGTPANVTVDANGTGIVNLTAPSVPPTPDVTAPQPGLDAPAALTVAAPTVPAGTRIEDVLKAAQAQLNGEAPAPQAEGDSAPGTDEGVTPDSAGTPNPATDVPGASGPLVFQAPPRTPDGEPVAIAVSSQEELEALQRLNNGYMRREALAAERAAIAEERSVQQAFTQRLEADPIGFIIDNLPDAVQVQVAEVLLARLAGEHASRFDTLLGDETSRRETLLESREKREAHQRAVAERNQLEQYRMDVEAAIESLIPDAATDAERAEFVVESSLYLQHLLRTGNTVEPAAVPSLLAGKAARYGFTTQAPPSRPANVSGSKPVPAAAAPAPAPAPAPTVKPAVPLSPAQMMARATAAAVLPAGAGAVPSTQAAPPKGLRIEDAAAWYKDRARAAS